MLADLRVADVGVQRARAETDRAAGEVRTVEEALRRAQRTHDLATAAKASDSAEVAARRADLAAANDAVRLKRVHMSRMARETYVHTGDTPLEDLRLLLTEDAIDDQAHSRLVSGTIIESEATELRDLLQLVPPRRVALRAAQERQHEADDELRASARQVRAAGGRVEAERDVLHEAQLAELVARAAQAGHRNELSLAAALPPQEVPTTVTVLGQQRLSAEDLAGWFVQSGYTSQAQAPITDLATFYIEEGAAEGVRGDIAFAQAILETGGFRNRDSIHLNNYSGIGHCDSCGSGWRFPSPRAGVRAQIQLLKSYALKNATYRYPLVDRRLRGPAGCCQTWQELTSVWATGPQYGQRIMEIYAGIVDYALTRRTSILRSAGLPVVVPPAPPAPVRPPPIVAMPSSPKLVPPPPPKPPATTTTRPPTTTTRPRPTTTRPPATTTTRPRPTTTTTRPPTTTTTTTTAPPPAGAPAD